MVEHRDLHPNGTNIRAFLDAFEFLVELRWRGRGNQITADAADGILTFKELGKRHERLRRRRIVHVAESINAFSNSLEGVHGLLRQESGEMFDFFCTDP